MSDELENNLKAMMDAYYEQTGEHIDLEREHKVFEFFKNNFILNIKAVLLSLMLFSSISGEELSDLDLIVHGFNAGAYAYRKFMETNGVPVERLERAATKANSESLASN